MAEHIFHVVDYIVTVAALLISLALGIYFALPKKKETTTGDYFVGSRQMNIIPVATSMAVTYLSAITILGFPAEVYYYGIIFAYYCVGRALGFSFAALFYVPVLYPLKISSGNQYLAMRYRSQGLVKYACVVQIISKIVTSGTYLYGPAILVQLVTGIPPWASLLVSGLVGTAYTTVGGYKAVIATDVFQAGVMLLGLIAVLALGLINAGGWSNVWQHYKASGRADINHIPDPFAHNSIWVMVIMPAIADSWNAGIMQAGVQRYCSMPTVEKARWMLILAIPPMVIMTTLATLMGVVAYGYYANLGCDPLAAGLISNLNMITPKLVTDILRYPGLPGLFISSCICGALSNFSSTLNAIAGLCWEDLVSTKFQKTSEAAKVRITKIIAVIFGALSTGAGFVAMSMSGTIMKVCIGLAAAGMTPLGLLFALGIFFPRTNWKNALVTSLVGFAVVITITIGGIVTPFKHQTMPLPIHGCNALQSNGLGNNNDSESLHLNTTFSKQHRFTDETWLQNNTLIQDGLKPGFIRIGKHQERTIFQKLMTISNFWYLFCGLIVGVCVSVVLSVIPGFYTTNVDQALIFTFSKLFVRTSHHEEDAAKHMLKNSPEDQNGKPALIIMHEYFDEDDEKSNINGKKS